MLVKLNLKEYFQNSAHINLGVLYLIRPKEKIELSRFGIHRQPTHKKRSDLQKDKSYHFCNVHLVRRNILNEGIGRPK